jgi:hypothetical protein
MLSVTSALENGIFSQNKGIAKINKILSYFTQVMKNSGDEECIDI